ncbi:hypothetical protein UPYG_G00009710 [Umbra pygmaea]|uniref:SRCR domain-containing protein n=1 Tax=Umbra pygmaea TaxID=75934 RepID=A0ABD0XI98_UMBPY
MWFLLLLFYASFPYLSSAAGDKIILSGGTGPCEGYVEVYHNNTWGVVGTQKWKKENADVICRSIDCGTATESKDYHYSDNLNDFKSVLIDEVECIGHEKHLWECNFPGWKTSSFQTLKTKKIKCTDNITLQLEHKCGGIVTYSRTSKMGKTTTGFFCDDKWDLEQANRVCEHLKCNKSKQLLPSGIYNELAISIHCDPHQKHLWQCRNDATSCKKPVGVICSNYHDLRLNNKTNACSGVLEVKDDDDKWKPICQSQKKNQILNELSSDDMCKQMRCGSSQNKENLDCENKNISLELECTGKVGVVLLNSENNKCFGSVQIKNNGNNEKICGDRWENKDGQVVCQQLGCGDVLSVRSEGPPSSTMQMECNGSEISLWHCQPKGLKNLCKQAYVICSASVDVRLSDGTGRCAGRVEIYHDGKWKSVYKNNWSDQNSKVMCKHLKCGKDLDHQDQFIKGDGPYIDLEVTCNAEDENMSQCIKASTKKTLTNPEYQALVCEDHKVVFLKGNTSCSGHVAILQAKKTYWLSNDGWDLNAATVVCGQMYCGKANTIEEVIISENTTHPMWNYTYHCSSTEKSLFDCNQTNSEGKNIAYVKCSGTIAIDLITPDKSEGTCWGAVQVCIGERCGGVCEDAWEDNRSNLLCQDLGCGKAIYHTSQLTQKILEVTISSIHVSEQITNLSQSNIVTNDGSYCKDKPIYVVCSESVKKRLQDPRDVCSGNLQTFYKGEWSYVCESTLTTKEQNITCQELDCGQAVGVLPYFGPTNSNGLSKLPNGADKESYKDIPKISCQLGGLKCTNFRRMVLENGHTSCDGQVLVYTHTLIHPVSSDDWTETEGKELCKYLGCGGYTNHSTLEDLGDLNKWWNRTFSCKGKPNIKTIWDCETDKPPTGKKPLYVSCKDNFKVSLSVNGNISKCYGRLKLNDKEVCGDHWTSRTAGIACRELQCGSSIYFEEPSQASSQQSGFIVSCMGNNEKLGQCKITMGRCTKKMVSVYCADGVNFTLSEKRGGKIQIHYRGKWESVCPLEKMDSPVATKICEHMNISGVKYIKEGKETMEKIETTLECSANDNALKLCIKTKKCKQPGELYCEGYVKQDPPSYTYLIVGLLVGAFVLVMVIALFLFLRRRFGTAGKSRLSLRKESTFESGDYEDIETDGFELERNGRTDLKQHETGGEMEKDQQSEASSQAYDDIVEEERALTQPLTKQREESGDQLLEAGVDPTNRPDTYEVEEDSGDGYDDVVTEARDEVPELHERPDTTEPEVQNDEDYLEVDEDG